MTVIDFKTRAQQKSKSKGKSKSKNFNTECDCGDSSCPGGSYTIINDDDVTSEEAKRITLEKVKEALDKNEGIVLCIAESDGNRVLAHNISPAQIAEGLLHMSRIRGVQDVMQRRTMASMLAALLRG